MVNTSYGGVHFIFAYFYLHFGNDVIQYTRHIFSLIFSPVTAHAMEKAWATLAIYTVIGEFIEGRCVTTAF